MDGKIRHPADGR
jgi:hypothetical protein